METDYAQGYQKIADKYGFKFDQNYKSEAAVKYAHAYDVKTRLFILQKEDFVFIAYDTRSTTAYMGTTYSGLYTTLNARNNLECKIAKRIPILDMFMKPVAGNKTIDKQVTLKTNDPEQTNSLIDETIIQDYLKFWNSAYPSEIIIGNNILLNRNIDLLSNRYNVGIEFKVFLDPKILSDIFPQIEKLLHNIQQKSLS